MGDWLSTIIGLINGYPRTPGTGGSVPVPETLLVFALGFAAFVVWRAKRVEE
jgi:hypothetical protein